jgi:antitoxin component of MazEF toxin-antitoxin module
MIALQAGRNYSYNMKKVHLKVARIGNSRGVRIPAQTLKRYRIGPSVLMEERSDGILLRPQGAFGQKLSWEDTAREMGAATEDWKDWDSVASDGIDSVPWHSPPARRVAEPKASYKKHHPRPGS